MKVIINQDRLGTNVGKVEGERRFCRAPHTVPMEERVVIPDYSKQGAAQSLKESLERMGGACAEPFSNAVFGGAISSFEKPQHVHVFCQDRLETNQKRKT